jgi:exonuclease SbcD
MRILHTSDWHLGQFFINKSRQQEHQAFIQWLLSLVKQQGIDAVIIAGDVFDTGAPPSYARELYNQFVIGMHELGCQLVILAGNHDSVSTLNESKELLAQLNTQVIASASDDLQQQVISLKGQNGKIGAIVCAIPYLRPRDILVSRSDESTKQKQQALEDAISNHYQQVYKLADEQRKNLDYPVAIVATGHLTAIGAKSSESVREIYIGNLEAFSANAFPAADYIALGHIHRAQKVAKTEHIRYSGSPIPLSFDELNNDKQVNLIDFKQGKLSEITEVKVPRFQPMQLLKGDLNSIEKQLAEFPDLEPNNEQDLPSWLSIEVATQDYLTDLQQRVQALCENKLVEVLQLRRARKQQNSIIEREDKEVLSELSPQEVFQRRLSFERFEGEKEQERLGRLEHSFDQIVNEIQAELDNED